MANTYNQKREEEALRLAQQKNKLLPGTALNNEIKKSDNLADFTERPAALGYKPSAQLQQAQQYAQQLQQQKPGAYQSAYTPQMQAQFDAIMNRQPFQYDLGTDAVFQQMSDMYVQQGRRAMQNAIGEATALTGGYGNSHAQGVGQAAFGNYLQQLGAQVPQFQQNTFARWQSEGADMMDRYNMAAAREESDYARYQDALSNYWAEADRAQQAADNMYNREYGEYMDNQALAQQKAEWNHSVSSEAREYAYSLAMMMLQGGEMPSAQVLEAAGISEQDAKAIKAMNTPKSTGGGGGSSGNNGSTQKESETAAKVQKNVNSYVESQIIGEEEIPSRAEWEAQRNVADPFNKAMKETTLATLPLTQGYKADPEEAIKNASKSNTEDYNNYVEKTIFSALDAGLIDKKKATDLAYKYLMD